MYLGAIVEQCSVETIFHTPMHPYTQALLMAAPVPDPKIAKNMPKPKIKFTEIPSMAKKPSGCHLHPRCVYMKPICSQQRPVLREVAWGHKLACHLAESLPKWEIPTVK